MTAHTFRYRKEDFGDLPVRLKHLTIYLSFRADVVEAENCMEMSALRDLEDLSLDARDLEVLSAGLCSGPADETDSPLEFTYREEHDKLEIRFPKKVSAGETFFVRTRTRCRPSDHLLEGIYRDATPQGAPQQYMSQCQQWGFQRIMPIFDDCRAKCTMTTTLEADRAYTHLISNGNISRTKNPDGRPVPKPGDPSRQVITFENETPMAPYLFLACAGTWDVLAGEVTYPSGRTVRLEYLVPPGSAPDAQVPLEILRESVLWIGKTQGYEYTADTYRTICMTKSNFGGMENVGNTTIVTDAALVTEHTLDSALLYAHAVIVHEFEHNQCGSETTMDTPFDVWLNEAYTVDVERQFMAHVFDPAFVRLNQVDSIRNPLLGPLAIEDAGHYGRIVRQGFNDPDELIDSVTYVKAAEVIRMLRLVVGSSNFGKAKELYFSRYHHGNATTDQFFGCFEEISGIDLGQFRREWLYRIGYPKVSATVSYDNGAGACRILLRQEGEEGKAPFHLPLEIALVDGSGRDITGTSRVIALREREQEILIENLPEEPAFASLNRGYSFYGTFRTEGVSAAALNLQARLDPDAVNRVDAMRQLTDRERIRLLEDPEALISEEWLGLYGTILTDRTVPLSLKAFLLRIDEQPVDRAYAAWFPELVLARERLMTAVNGRYRETLVTVFSSMDTRSPARSGSFGAGIEMRMLKNLLLDLIAVDDSPGSHDVITDHLRSATTATDRVAALMALNRSSSPLRLPILEETFEAWHRHLSGYANYLRIVSSGTRDDVFSLIEREKRRPAFDITQPTWSRALLLTMAANNKMVWSDRGIAWVGDTVIELAPFNATTTGRLLNTFQQVGRLKPALKQKVISALERIVATVSPAASPAVHGQASAYLKGARS